MKNNEINAYLCQFNPTVGDIRGNAEKIEKIISEHEKLGTELVLFPELSVTGYPPEDLLLKKSFIAASENYLMKIAKKCGKITAVVGFARNYKGKTRNSAAVISNGKIQHIYDKVLLPNYGVFDEKRYFTAGEKPLIFVLKGIRFGLTICEDIWERSEKLKPMKGKVDCILNISASPYHMGKTREREKTFAETARFYKAAIVYCNMSGGQDELVFDGASLCINSDGKVSARGAQFSEKGPLIKICGKKIYGENAYVLKGPEEVYAALVAGTRDYLLKNGFKKAFVALSGGVDSALVSVIAADAIGKENVNLVYMPSMFSSEESYNDAKKLCKNIGVKLNVIPIQKIVNLYKQTLKPFFKDMKADITEENIQARIRGNLIMALSNKFGAPVLTTGNKSEMSTGYATLYGDMAGGYAVIKDVPKTLVYKICEYVNESKGKGYIPDNILKKAPTAELRFNQKDQDTLPPYGILDKIIEEYVEHDKTYGDLKGKYDDEILKKTIKMIDFSEYKRRQAPPGVKITPKAYGRDRRMPITNKFRD